MVTATGVIQSGPSMLRLVDEPPLTLKEKLRGSLVEA